MEKDKYIIEKGIDYLKHWQDHNMFNYNVYYNRFFGSSLIILSIVIIFFSLVPTQFITLVVLLGGISILLSFLRIINKVKNTEYLFTWRHKKLKKGYEKLGVDVDSLDNPQKKSFP